MGLVAFALAGVVTTTAALALGSTPTARWPVIVPGEFTPWTSAAIVSTHELVFGVVGGTPEHARPPTSDDYCWQSYKPEIASVDGRLAVGIRIYGVAGPYPLDGYGCADVGFGRQVRLRWRGPMPTDLVDVGSGKRKRVFDARTFPAVTYLPAGSRFVSQGGGYGVEPDPTEVTWGRTYVIPGPQRAVDVRFTVGLEPWTRLQRLLSTARYRVLRDVQARGHPAQLIEFDADTVTRRWHLIWPEGKNGYSVSVGETQFPSRGEPRIDLDEVVRVAQGLR